MRRGGFLALVGEDVNQSVVGPLALVHWSPIAEVRHSVLFKKLNRVIAETGIQIVEFARSCGVRPQLEYSRFPMAAGLISGE